MFRGHLWERMNSLPQVLLLSPDLLTPTSMSCRNGTRSPIGCLTSRSTDRPGLWTWTGYERNHAAIQNPDDAPGPGDHRVHLDTRTVLRCRVLGGDPGHHLRAAATPTVTALQLAAQRCVSVYVTGMPADRYFADDHHQCPAGAGGHCALQKPGKRRTGHRQLPGSIQGSAAAVLSAPA